MNNNLTERRAPKELTPVRMPAAVNKDTKRKSLVQKDLDELVHTLQKLGISKEKSLIDEFLSGTLCESYPNSRLECLRRERPCPAGPVPVVAGSILLMSYNGPLIFLQIFR